MPQHIWLVAARFRICEDCRAYQVNDGSQWGPPVYPICPGDDDDDDRPSCRRRRPNAPAGSPSPRVLEDA